jgi:hypothetical protein
MVDDGEAKLASARHSSKTKAAKAMLNGDAND